MGSPESEKNRWEIEKQVEVTLTKGFWMMETEVSQELFQAVTGQNPSSHKGSEKLPVEHVSWESANDFARKLNEILENELTAGGVIVRSRVLENEGKAAYPAGRYSNVPSAAQRGHEDTPCVRVRNSPLVNQQVLQFIGTPKARPRSWPCRTPTNFAVSLT
jgi:hypothetical protein